MSEQVRALIQAAEVPPALAGAKTAAAQQLAVRSSAAGEDDTFSFAGQFATLLNLRAAAILDQSFRP